MAKISVGGKQYEVLDNLGFQHSAGVYAKEVSTPDGTRMAVRDHGQKTWRFWGMQDMLRPGGVVTGQ